MNETKIGDGIIDFEKAIDILIKIQAIKVTLLWNTEPKKRSLNN